MDHPVPPPSPGTGEAAPLPDTTSAHPAGRWYVELGWHLLAAALTVGVLVAGLRLDRADFHAPFSYEHDALLILPMVQCTVEHGSHWRNDRLGAPGVSELQDYPVIDHLHFAAVRLLGVFFPDPVVAFNLYHLLTYPLTAVTGMFVLRRFGLSVPAAVCGGVLYAFQPYHYLRGQTHFFLSAYYVVPLTLMIILWVCRGRLPFFRKDADGRDRFGLRTRDTLVAVLIGLATASAGAYYAFFACALLVMAGAYGWAAARTWRAAAAAAGLIAVIVLGGVANHAPTFPYAAANGYNSRVHTRLAEEAEIYGLKIAQLILPVQQHNPIGYGKDVLFDPAGIRSMYQAPQFKSLNESEWDPFGLVGAVGYLALLAAVLFPRRWDWPVGPLAALTVFATLVATTGGLSAVFNLLVTAQIRCPNRISIYLAFLALFAACWWIDRYFDTRTGWARRLRWPAFLAIVLFGVWDQTNDVWFPDMRQPEPGYVSADEARDETAKKWWADREFFAHVEQLTPDGVVFTYPYLEYPEAAPYSEPGSLGRTESYDMIRGCLHAPSLRWSFGAMKGREWDTWMRDVTRLVAFTRSPNAEQFLQRLVAAGFDGLLIDQRGLNPVLYGELTKGLDAALGHGSARVRHPDNSLIFFTLRPYRDYLLRTFGQSQFDAMTRAEREAPMALWLKGFRSYEPTGYEWRSHHCQPEGQIVLVNRTDHPITVQVRMRFRTVFKGPGQLRIDAGEQWREEYEIGHEQKPPEHVRTLVLQPGKHKVRLYCTPKVNVLPTDSRREIFAVLDFRMAEVPPGGQ